MKRAGGSSGGGGASGTWEAIKRVEAKVNAINSTHTSNYVSLNGHVQNLLNWQRGAKVQLGKINGINNEVNSLKRWKSSHDAWGGTQARRISTLESWRTSHNTWAGKLAGRVGKIEDWRKGHDEWAGKLSGRVDKHQAWIDNHNIWAGKLYRRVDSIEKWKGGHDEFASNLVKRMDIHDEWAGNQAQKLTKLEKRVDELKPSFSDAAIIASINFQGKANTDLWNAEHYDGGSINEKDGKAVKLFKVQFQGLKSHVSAMLKAYFGKEGIYTGIMQSPLKRMIALLEAIRDKKIQVEIPEIKIPEIKVTEIKNMPDINLSKKGNGWLKTLIETVGGIIETAIKVMGEVLGKAIDGVSENLGKLVDLVSGLLNDVVKLIVPENLDFMNKRFDGFQKKIKVKFNFLFSGIDGFKGLFSNQKKIEDVDLTLGVFGNEGSVKIPLSWIGKVTPFVRPIITGFIALEFLIDMYKWFHMRGEVVE